MPSILHYAPPSAALRRWRGRVGIVIAAIVTAAAAVGAYPYAAGAVLHVRLTHYQRQCLTHVLPSDHVVYEEHEVGAAELLRGGSARGGRWYELPPQDRPTDRIAAWQPSCLHRYVAALNARDRYAQHAAGKPDSAVVFVHERRCPAGRTRMLVVRIEPGTVRSVFSVVRVDAYDFDRRTGEAFDANWGACGPQTSMRGPASLVSYESQGYRFDFNRATPVRVFAGRPDPSDASRFYFFCEAGGRRYRVEGFLAETDRPRWCGNAPRDRVELHAEEVPMGVDN